MDKTLTRMELLEEIECRLRAAGIFHLDIWERILQTETAVLREILQSNFEEEVLNLRGKS